MSFLNWYLQGVKKVSSHAHIAGTWYLLGALFKISDEHPRTLYMVVPPGGVIRSTVWGVEGVGVGGLRVAVGLHDKLGKM